MESGVSTDNRTQEQEESSIPVQLNAQHQPEPKPDAQYRKSQPQSQSSQWFIQPLHPQFQTGQNRQPPAIEPADSECQQQKNCPDRRQPRTTSQEGPEEDQMSAEDWLHAAHHQEAGPNGDIWIPVNRHALLFLMQSL